MEGPSFLKWCITFFAMSIQEIANGCHRSEIVTVKYENDVQKIISNIPVEKVSVNTSYPKLWDCYTDLATAEYIKMLPKFYFKYLSAFMVRNLVQEMRFTFNTLQPKTSKC